MCKYCEAVGSKTFYRGKELREVTALHDERGLTICLTERGMLYVISTKAKQLLTQVEINFCPMCGRKFRQDKIENEQLKLFE